jgi:hypothetical protein
LDKDHREQLLIFCHLVKCVSSAMHNVNGQHIGESDYWFSVTARLPWSFKSTLLANQNSTCHENIRYIHLQQAWTYTSLKSRLQIIQASWFKCGVVAVAMSFTDRSSTQVLGNRHTAASFTEVCISRNLCSWSYLVIYRKKLIGKYWILLKFRVPTYSNYY